MRGASLLVVCALALVLAASAQAPVPDLRNLQGDSQLVQTGSQFAGLAAAAGQGPASPTGVPSYVAGLPQPYPMASPYSMGHVYGGYGFPVHPMYRAMHAMIGAPPPPLVPYGAPYYPPYQ